MSIVAEVLQSTGKLAKENIVLKVDDLKRKLEVIKLDVEEALKQKYVDFIPQYIKMDKLLVAFRRFSEDYELLHNQIEKEIKPQMVNSVAEFHDVLEDLKKTKALKAVVRNLIKLHQHLESAKKSQSQSAYLDAAHCMVEFETVFKEIDSNHPKDIAIMCTLKTEFYVTKESMVYEIEKIWKKNVVISSQIEGKNKKFVVLSLNKETTGFKELLTTGFEELLRALHMLNYLRPVLRSFGQQFLKLLCEVLISNHVKVNINEKTHALTVDVLNAQSPPPTEVFESVNIVFQFMYDELFKLTVVNEDGSEISSMREFGAVIAEDFCSLIIEKCLKIAIPKQSKQLDAFYQEIIAVNNFCNSLQTMEFLTSSNNLLLNFIRNVDVLPVNKMAQDILSRARSLMKKSLHQTVIHGVESMSSVESDVLNMSETARKKSGLSKSTFSFPRCQISVSMKELVKLLNEVKEEAKNIGPAHVPRLYYVSRCICELYCSVVPTFHKEEIQNIPQQTAIFHNNCMYLAHEICNLGSHYECDLQAHIPMTFVDLVPEIKKLGTEAFLSQMRHQKQQLLQLIQEQQAYQTIMMDEGLVNKAEKSIRQCLCQLQLLKKVWSDILPSEVYFKAVGTLLNTCLEEIILRILSMEDISADAAAQMDNIFSILLKQGPDLFQIQNIDKKNSVHIYVKRWFKFQELQLVLSVNLREIVDRWASGKGPLATHFSSDDVKHLIRALFQNTERRAAALAKIR